MIQGKKRCQSCGQPLAENNASANQDYCAFCWQDSDFKEPGMTLDQMIERSVQHMTRQLKFEEERARVMATAVIPSLKRWRKTR